MDKVMAVKVNAELEAAINAVLAANGLKRVKHTMKYSEVGFKLTVEAAQPGAVNASLIDYLQPMYPDIDLSKTPFIQFPGKPGTYRVVDKKSRGASCWVIENVETKHQGKVPFSVIQKYFAK